jgi:heterodisulfide reductase subunit A
MKVGAINFYQRGVDKKIGTPYDKHSPICIACGACQEICPAECIDLSKFTTHRPRPIPAEFEQGLATRPSIYSPFPQAVPKTPVIDPNTCLRLRDDRCGACETVCEAGAIDFNQRDTIKEINVGTIIVATGFELFDAKKIARYGYGRLPNVVNSLEFERMSHASGPTGGEILTQAGEVPKAVAIIHCVGSRDENTHEYCSRVCCMYSLKFAHLVKEKTGAEVYNLYIDMRTPGKGYEEFYKRLLREDVHFIRGRCAEVTDVAETPQEKNKLMVICEDTLLGVARRLPVDMVILSAGLRPAAGAEELARKLSLSCAQGDFFLEKHPKLAPVEAASDGLFLAGACQGPRDIPDSVAQGAAAAACAMSLMDRGDFVLEPITAEIDADRCSGCKMCISVCPYDAIEFDEDKKVSAVREELCKGCGTCVATCPSGIATQKGFADTQIFAEIEGILNS